MGRTQRQTCNLVSMATAPASRARVYPVGRAVLLLGIAHAALAGRRVNVDGRRVQSVRYGSLALIVAFVDQIAYDHDEIARKRGEVSWLATEARAHERAVDRLASNGDILPMKLLTVFPHADVLEAYALASQARWTRALARVATKRECVVHVYAGPHVAPGKGAYVARVSECATRVTRLPVFKGETPLREALASLWRDCMKLGLAARRVVPMPARGAHFSLAILLPHGDVDALGALVERWNARGAALGLTAYCEGPRRPFTFVV